MKIDGFGVLLTGCLFFLCLLFALCLYADFEAHKREQQCFMQEPRTKECEFILWARETQKQTRTAIVPIVAGR